MKSFQLFRFISKLAVLMLANIIALPSLAHQGWALYGEEEFTPTATVVEKHFGNPHDRMIVEADGQLWNLLMSPPRRSRRAGFSSAAVEVGDTIAAYGHRHRGGDLEMFAERIEVGDNTYDLYPSRLLQQESRLNQ